MLKIPFTDNGKEHTTSQTPKERHKTTVQSRQDSRVSITESLLAGNKMLIALRSYAHGLCSEDGELALLSS